MNVNVDVNANVNENVNVNVYLNDVSSAGADTNRARSSFVERKTSVVIANGVPAPHKRSSLRKRLPGADDEPTSCKRSSFRKRLQTLACNVGGMSAL